VTVLATFVGGWGHAEPLLPTAELAVAAGHRVCFAGQAAVVPRLAALGFETFVVGPDTLATERLPLVPVDREGERAVLRDHFVRRYGTERAATLTALFEQEQPSVVLCDEVDAGAVVAAEAFGIPCVTVTVLAAGRMRAPGVVGDAWNELRAGRGLPADDGCARLGGTLTLAPLPRSFRDPALPWPATMRAVRPPVLDQAERVPGGPRPFVYATLGTVFNVESGDLLDRLVRALGRVPADALVTVGPNIAPEDFGAVAPNVRVEQFVPQHEVLGRCAAVVSHGGSGTLMAALSLGVPAVLLPMGADQPDNADRCDDLGVGVVLDPMTADAATIAAAVDTVTANDRYARAAAVLAADAAAQPRLADVSELVALLE
jgi:UDP:flavonoid glycosyltransferase YjiC (YdhE family)